MEIIIGSIKFEVNLIIGIIFYFVFWLIIIKIWMKIAACIGNEIGIGKFIIMLCNKIKALYVSMVK
jgi:hypothetical protein